MENISYVIFPSEHSFPLEDVSQSRSWFESLTTNGIA